MKFIIKMFVMLDCGVVLRCFVSIVMVDVSFRWRIVLLFPSVVRRSKQIMSGWPCAGVPLKSFSFFLFLDFKFNQKIKTFLQTTICQTLIKQSIWLPYQQKQVVDMYRRT
jgi:hypothetical protein